MSAAAIAIASAATELTSDLTLTARLIEEKYAMARCLAECHSHLRATQMQLARLLETLGNGAALVENLRADCEAALRLTGREPVPTGADGQPAPLRRRYDKEVL